MSLKISELTASSGVTPDDIFPIVNDPAGTPQTLKVTAEQILNYVTGSTFNELTVTVVTASVISASQYIGLTGGGDVTSAGNNTFTGINTFENNVSGTDAEFINITASVISASTYIGISNVSQTLNKLTISSSTVLAINQRVVFATNNLDPNLSITLPAVIGSDSGEYYIIKADNLTGSVFISGNLSDTINGQNVYELNGPYQSITLINDNTSSWYVF